LEKTIWREKPTVLAFYDGLTCGGLLIAVSAASLALFPTSPFWWVPALGLAVAASTIMFSFVKAWANTYILTKEKLRREYRFVASSIEEVPLEKVTNIIVVQDVVGRLLGFGTIRADTAGTAYGGIIFRGVRNPDKAFKVISEAKNAAEKPAEKN